MTDAEKVKLQQQIIKELTEENEALKHDGKLLIEENAMLRKTKDEADIEQAQQLLEMKVKIEEYRETVAELQRLKKQYQEEKRNYEAFIANAKKEARQIVESLK